MAKAEVRGGSVASKGVEIAAADEDHLGDAEGGGAPSKSADVVSLSYVVHHHVALPPHFRCFYVRERVGKKIGDFSGDSAAGTTAARGRK